MALPDNAAIFATIQRLKECFEEGTQLRLQLEGAQRLTPEQRVLHDYLYLILMMATRPITQDELRAMGGWTEEFNRIRQSNIDPPQKVAITRYYLETLGDLIQLGGPGAAANANEAAPGAAPRRTMGGKKTRKSRKASRKSNRKTRNY